MKAGLCHCKDLKREDKDLKEMASMAGFYFHEHIVYDEDARQRYLNEETLPVLEAFLEGFKRLKSLKEEEQKGLIEELIKRFNKKAVDIIQPIRVALSGRTASPGIFEVIEILGREVVERRIKEAIETIRQQ
jgi:glutamyl-tRNA synthetase